MYHGSHWTSWKPLKPINTLLSDREQVLTVLAWVLIVSDNSFGKRWMDPSQQHEGGVNWWFWGRGHCCSVLCGYANQIGRRRELGHSSRRGGRNNRPIDSQPQVKLAWGTEQGWKPQMCHSWATKKTSGSLHGTSEPGRPLFALPTTLHPLLVKSPSETEKRKAGGRGEGQHRYKQKASCLWWKQKETQRRKTLSFCPSRLFSCRSTSERCVRSRFPSPASGPGGVPVGAAIEAEWTAADGQEREGLMKRARRMALAPAGEQSAGSQDECVWCVCVCGCVCVMCVPVSSIWFLVPV